MYLLNLNRFLVTVFRKRKALMYVTNAAREILYRPVDGFVYDHEYCSKSVFLGLPVFSIGLFS